MQNQTWALCFMNAICFKKDYVKNIFMITKGMFPIYPSHGFENSCLARFFLKKHLVWASSSYFLVIWYWIATHNFYERMCTVRKKKSLLKKVSCEIAKNYVGYLQKNIKFFKVGNPIRYVIFKVRPLPEN